MTRKQLLEQLAEIILGIDVKHPVRVGIDGTVAAGKTVFANQLEECIKRHGRPVIRASVDDFHLPSSHRYKKGMDSPEGYYQDSFDYAAVRTAILLPLGPDGNRKYTRSTFDVLLDVPVRKPFEVASENSILLFDGVFLFRPELSCFWEYKIFLEVDFQETLKRASIRDRAEYDSVEALQKRFLTRYVAGARIYLNTINPQRIADMTIDNTDPLNPKII